MGEELSLSEILRRIEAGALRPEEGLELMNARLGGAEAADAPPARVDLVSRAVQLLKSVLAAQTKLPLDGIDPEEPFESYGIDSTMIVGLNRRLEQYFGELSKTIFFEHRSISQMALYLSRQYAAELEKLSEPGVAPQPGPGAATDPVRSRFIPAQGAPGPATTATGGEIAIIGLSGRYPQARNLAEFWANLKQGKDCVTEIPPDRWDWRRYFNPDPNRRDTVYTKWGGFLADADKFDPLFFQITPREAEVIDPQERLFLQTAWHTFEDAGYTRDRVAKQKVGVFVGVMYGQYQIYGTDVDPQALVPTSSHASVANRVSFCFDLRGPSMAVDSMCSSSLTAIHMACESLRRGESEMALAGGVNLSLHPLKYSILSQQRFASTDGRCRAFGEGGDGYVPGEGVGAVLLKPLDRAIADGDHIYAVIKADVINHGGRTHGYSVPNPNAQAELIAEALERSGIHPRTISYIEAHGTGTSLGDPIEITGLTGAFSARTPEKQFCAIGSVKASVGHLEAAAGIAGLTKVLLQMQHGELVPSLHADQLNPNIAFQGSPFYVQRTLTPWQRPVVAENGLERTYPRRAGLSAFGAGGTNVHLLLEEYCPAAAATGDTAPVIIPLSARNRERLLEAAAQLRAHLELTPGARLCDIAYTLQVGREPMEERLALVVSSRDELLEKLALVAGGGEAIPGCYQGQAARTGRTQGPAAAATGDLAELARGWAAGMPVDWESLYGGARPARISLPGYPFARERYWVRTRSEKALAEAPAEVPVNPLLPQLREAGADGQRFEQTLQQDQFVLRDHVVAGKQMLPGVAYLEIARAAAAQAGGRPVRRIRNLVWERPVILEEKEAGLFTRLGGGRFDIRSRSGLHASGEYDTGEVGTSGTLDLTELRRRCPQVRTHDEIYRQLERIGFGYGPGFRVTRELRCGEWEALAELRLPAHLQSDFPVYGLHPSLMDGALRAALGIGSMLFADAPVLRVPFALDELEILQPLTETCFAYAVIPPEHRNGGGELVKCNVTIVSPAGAELVRIKGFAARPLKAAADQELLFYAPRWVERQPEQAAAVSLPQAVLLLADQPDLGDRLEQLLRPATLIRVLSGAQYAQHGPHQFTIRLQAPEDYRQMLQALRAQGLDSFQIAHCLNLAQTGAEPGLEPALNAGLWSLLHLFQAVHGLGLQSRSRCLFAYAGAPGLAAAVHGAVAGFARSLLPVSDQFELITLQVDDAPAALPERLYAELAAPGNRHGEQVAHAGGVRHLQQMVPVDVPTDTAPQFRTGGVYLITGGAGSLGMAVARHLAREYQAALMLLGRSAATPSIEAALAELKALGADAVYHSADVADLAAVQGAVAQAKARFGRLDGIIHCAGIVGSTPVTQADPASFRQILAPKLLGTLNLDQATRDEHLDLFLLFSSVSAILGDFGSCSYATANTFLDRFAAERTRLCSQGLRHGRTLSVNWPWWDAGGMSLPREEAELYKAHLGMRPLPTEQGLRAMELALATGLPQVAVAYGEPGRISRAFKVANTDGPVPATVHAAPAPAATAAGNDWLLEQTVLFLKNAVSEVTRLPLARIDAQTDLEQYGLDSVMVMELSRRLEQELGALPRTLFFEFRNLRALAAHLCETHGEQLAARFGAPQPALPETAVLLPPAAAPAPGRPAPASARPDIPVAIIGVSGRYPMAADLDQFWENLKTGRDCITEIPRSRWDNSRFYDPQKGKKGKIYCQYGGFIDDADRFDPLFFRISPREATLLDPQERLFLQTVWQTVEDAGYTRSSLKQDRVGVFVGAMYSHYQLHGVEETQAGRAFAATSFFSSIANRVSYFMDFDGPSLALDTACSSSLEALRLAYEHIRSGQCEMAIAGGVNLSLHPNKYIFLCQSSFLSPDGRCRSFGAGGDGYVPGEGVGAVLLKPLDRAVADGDHIYAVIRGAAVNHGGKSNGYSVPTPAAQARVISEALQQSGVDPQTISYIEAHGTGTSLGDPIEVTGLTRAFAGAAGGGQVCALGSVKSNIGHLEAAAGIAGITKVLLQLQHKQLVPSLHSRSLNPNIDFSGTPFRVQQELAPWQPPAASPRRAGVSAFGAGGTNVHVILEEHVEAAALSAAEAPQLILLSAQTADRLRARAEQLIRYLNAPDQGVDLGAIAYTLQVGREHMEHRLALIGRSRDEVRAKLLQFLQGEGEKASWWRGELAEQLFEQNDREEQEYLQAIAQKGNLEKLAKLWVNGAAVDWAALCPGARRRVSLPAYPFQGERYWLAIDPQSGSAPSVGRLHPLIDVNASTLQETCFRKVLTGDDFVLRAHDVAGQLVLPGAAILEMARAAGELVGLQSIRHLQDVVWAVPVLPGEVSLSLVPEPGGAAFQVYSRKGDDRVVHARGRLVQADAVDAARLPVQEILSRCTRRIDRAELYASLRQSGFNYGPEFQVTEELLVGEAEAVARLALPGMLTATAGEWGLHPSLLDGALRAVGGTLAADRSLTGRTFVPFSLGRLEIIRPLPERCLAHAVRRPESADGLFRFDLTVMDEQGALLLRLSDFTVREFRAPTGSDARGPWYYRMEWQAAAPAPAAGVPAGPVLLLDGDARRRTELERLWPGGPGIVLVTPGAAYRKVDDRHYVINPAEPADYVALLGDLADRPAYLLHLWNLNGENQVLDLGVHSAQFLLQAVTACGWEHRIRTLFAHPLDAQPAVPWHAMLSGFARSLTTVNHRFELISMETPRDVETSALAAELLNPGNGNGTEIRRAPAGRAVRTLLPLDAPPASGELPLQPEGVYLITGGAGGLGMLLARYLARRCRARVVLVGRSPLSEKTQGLLNELGDLGGEGLYLQADITSPEQAAEAVRQAKARFGRLHGLFHCAGVLGETPVTRASRSDLAQIYAPKVEGTLNLDLATREEPLDFVILFSSVAALLGDFGACAYAAGNSFMDRYAEYREQLRRAGQRSGRCLSVNWPLWQTGGMQLRGEESSLYAYSGMQMLTEEGGLAALGAAWQTGLAQVVVMAGDQAKIDRTLRVHRGGAPAVAQPEAPEAAPARPEGEEPLHQRAERYLKEQLAGVLGLPLERIHPRTELVAYGIDSVTVMEVSSRMERDFGPLPKTLLFEYNTVSKLAGWLVSQYPEQVAALPGPATGGAREAAVAAAPATTVPAAAPTPALAPDTTMVPTQAPTRAPTPPQAQPPGDEPIAVVGLGLRFPMADDAEQFWSNLKQGLNCITEVPKERWNHAEFYDAHRSQPGKAYSRWGGFVSDVDKFDPLAFNISPLEAEAMDPQERLFLEVAWASFEDGGISRREVHAADHKVGVFVGVMNCNYEWLGAVAADRGLPTNAHSAYWSIANRISFLFDFRGPSMAVDSACSSSMTAIHLACESIRRGECHMAVAGGVNLILHPAHYVRYSMMNMISEDHQCRSFGKDADGFVPGEGAGAVVLKPLRDAIRDGNQIYGVIRGSMVNAGGTTNGYTVPNPNAQASLISDALRRAEIHPRSISYVEAHGTGTSLGDPIEIRGLTKAFSQHTQDRQYCPIGSAKSNIGHLEAASGVAGLIKVLLQMKHRQLAPSLGADEVNPHIEFIESPFYVQRQLAPWAQPVIVEGGQARSYPRRAGVSSFGAGGANAHVIVEEYQPQAAPADTVDAPQIVILSARTEERLRAYAANLSAFLEMRCAAADAEAPEQLRPLLDDLMALVAETVGSEPAELDPAGSLDECGVDPLALADLAERINQRFGLGLSTQDLAAFPSLEALAGYLLARQRKAAPATGELTLGRLAYTLQTGRQVMKHRLALVAGSLEELMDKLRSYSGRQDDLTGIYTGHGAAPELPDEESVAAAIRSQDLIRIAQLWAAGATVDWELLHPGARPMRVSLPTYPFERQRHWLAGHSGPLAVLPAATGQAGGQIHPLVDRNCSTFREHRFVKRLTGQEFYLLQGDGQAAKLLPGLVLLEVARVAGTLGWEQPVSRIRNVVWADPPRLAESPRELQISFYPEGDQLAWFEVSATDTGSIYAQGQILLAGAAPVHAAGQVELEAVRGRCTDQGLGAEVKTALQRMRWSNALCRSAVRDLQAGPSECLARLEIPEGLRGDLERYSLHPALLTATWLVAAAWLHTTDTQTDPESGAGMPAIPAALSEAQLLAPLPAQCYLYLTTAENGSLTVRLLDAAGNLLVRMTDLATDRYVPEAAPIMLTNS